MRLILWPARLWMRCWRALSFKSSLNYSWRLAWYKADRSES